MRLYPVVTIIPLSFKGVKVVVVPNQSLTLKDIIKRFIRKEALPIQKEGMYEDRLGDLEKMAHEDITDQMDRVNTIKVKLAKIEKNEQEKNSRIKAAAEREQQASKEKEAAEKAASAGSAT